MVGLACPSATSDGEVGQDRSTQTAVGSRPFPPGDD